MRFVIALLALTAALARADQPLSVYTVNYPLQYFAERIGGERVRALYPGPADRDPSSWQPSHDVLRQYREADLVILNGAGYAGWTERAGLHAARSVDSSAAFREQIIAAGTTQESGDRRFGDDADAAAGFATWLDLYQAAQQAEAVMQALVDKRPRYRDEFEAGFRALHEELMQIDLALQRLVAKDPGKPLFVAQPVYAYLARRYALHLQSVDWKPDVMPGDDQWQQLVYAQEAFPALWMIWTSAPNREIRARLQDAGLRVLVFDTCATPPAQGDFMSCMRDNVAALTRAFD